MQGAGCLYRAGSRCLPSPQTRKMQRKMQRCSARSGCIGVPTRGFGAARFARAMPDAAQPVRRAFSASRGASRVVMAATSDDIDPDKTVATEGDLVTIHYTVRAEDGTVLQSTEAEGEEAICFEVGAGDVVGNPLFRGFDEAVRGMQVGQVTSLQASGGDWKPELLFDVPRSHPEMDRLMGRYKNLGGIVVGEYVELSNGGKALIVAADDENVRLDANNMLAGAEVEIDLTLIGIGSTD